MPTDLQEANVRYQENLNFFKNEMPGIYAGIATYSGKLNLNYSPSTKEFYKLKNDKSLYGESAEEHAKQEVSRFLDKMQRSDYRPKPSQLLITHLIKNKPFIKTNQLYAEQRDTDFNTLPCVKDIVIFGVGFALHIKELIETGLFRQITIIDHAFTDFLESLYVADWAKILKNLPKNTNIQLVLKQPQNNDQYYHDHVQHSMQSQFPSNAFTTLIYNHENMRDYEKEKDLIKALINYSQVVYEKLGPDAQRLMNFNENVKNCLPLVDLARTRERSNKRNIAIIGAGPSLDDFIPVIKEHRNKLILISSGSSLTTLLKEGIKPDFHYELEFKNLAHELIKNNNKIDTTNDIELISSIEVNPSIPKYFKKSYCIVPESSELAFRLPRPFILKRGGITCTNGAAAFASSITKDGDIFLFGLDFAYLDGKHHSKHNITNQTNVPEKLKYLEEHGKRLNKLGTYRVKGINGELLSTSKSLLAAKTLFERLVATSSCNFYNCSKGAYIEGTDTMTKAQLIEKLSSLPNKESINIVSKSFSTVDISEWTRVTLDSSFDVCNQFIDLVKKNMYDEPEIFCLKIKNIIKSIELETSRSPGQQRNIMSINRLPILMLYGIAAFVKPEKIQDHIGSWLSDYENYIFDIKEILIDRINNSKFLVKEDWVDH